MCSGVLASTLAFLACACAAGPRRPARHEEALTLTDPDAGYASEFYGHSGIALGVRGVGLDLGGDFDGETTLDGPDTIFLSDTDDGRGYELVFAIHDEGTAFEFGYSRTELEGEFGGFPGDVDQRAFGVRAIHYWRANERLQPLLGLGLFFPWADIEDGSSDGVAVGTGKLRSGFGGEVSGGVVWWLTRRLALDLRANALYEEFTRAEGVRGDEDEIDDPVSVTGLGLSVGLTWVVRRKR